MRHRSATGLLTQRLRFKAGLSLWAAAISSFVMIVAVSVSSGYRKVLKDAISGIVSDVVLTDSSSIRLTPELAQAISSVPGVKSFGPVVTAPSLVRGEDDIQDVLFKGVADSTLAPLEIRIPEGLADMLSVSEGDALMSYFISGKLRARKFTVAQIYTPEVSLDGTYIVYAGISDMRRLMSMDSDEATAVEIRLDERWRTRDGMDFKAGEIGYATGKHASSSARRFASVFDWLQLIGMNAVVILVLMALVAAFNMVSGFLIMVMRCTPEIGLLKTLGMNDAGISRIFTSVAARACLVGLLAGNAAALLLCAVQGATHFLKLDPANYFVSYVPVSLNPVAVLLADLFAWLLTLLLLRIPARQISRVDPAASVKGETE